MSHRSFASSVVAFAIAAFLSSSLHAQAGANRIRGELNPAQAGEFIGREATVCGTVDGFRFAENAEGQPTFLFMGGNFPAHRFSVRVWGRDRAALNVALDTLAGKVVCASGEIRTANGRPEIVVRRARDFQVK